MSEHHVNQHDDRTRELIANEGLPWRKAWRQAESELGPAPPQHQRPSDRPAVHFPVWPFVMLGASALFLVASFLLASLELFPYGGASSGDKAQFVNLMRAVFVMSWIGIPISFGSIALKSARTERAAAAAWIAVVVWVVLTVAAVIGLSSL